MTEHEAIRIVWEGLSGEASIPVKLRLGKHLDRQQLAAVKEAIRVLTERWQNQEMVPKRLAAAFVDLQGSMEWGRDLYPEKEQDEIEDAATELVQMAYELLGEE
jgi:hypothetical protein